MQAFAKDNLLVATAPAPSGKSADAVATSRPKPQEIIFFINSLSSFVPQKVFRDKRRQTI